MADPFSIVTGCVGLISAAGATVNAITSFVRDCRAARVDLTIVARELADLQLILELLKDNGQYDALPSPLKDQIERIVKRCSCIVSDINLELKRCKGKSGAVIWAADGKKAVEGLRRELATYRESLGLTVEMTALLVAGSIKEDTMLLRSAVPGIKHDTERILQEIQDFRTANQLVNEAPRTNVLLDSYLYNLTSYAETVCEEVIWDSENEDEKEADDGSQPAKPTETKKSSHPIKMAEELNRQEASDSEPAKQKCHSCELHKSNGGTFGLSCDHWLCAKCVKMKFKEAIRSHIPPKCCKKGGLSLRQASHVLDDELKSKFDKIWGYYRIICPRQACGWQKNKIVTRKSRKRRMICCSKCKLRYCAWCREEWHEKARSKCKADFQLLPSFPEKASD
ncbi:hypothetical protein CGLO_03002 [Colletotrichum gloeosporioides Cg-14]|uniref:Uncharacterized protein n=1 Tax=Colletotrichum gloeosporioides (strain Cg-14) TaxID=1237896 RepID=T0LZJ9_COLGC|nr:hypothetical protein CGLO_03002 [Colletotrichum gloeosporioides Cg-14]